MTLSRSVLLFREACFLLREMGVLAFLFTRVPAVSRARPFLRDTWPLSQNFFVKCPAPLRGLS